MWKCNDELRVRVDELLKDLKKDSKHYVGMPYYTITIVRWM